MSILDLDAKLAGLSDTLHQMSVKELGELIWSLEKDAYEQKPVSIEQFMEDPDFIPASGLSIYPFWKEELKKIYPTTFYSPYYEIISYLPIGSGKSVAAGVSITYDIHRIACLKNPQDYYNIMPRGVQIVFAMFSASKMLAEDVNWPIIESMMLHSPWFRRYCPLPNNYRLSKENPVVDLPKNLGIVLGSVEEHAIGKAVFGGELDEANFQRVKSEQALKSYTGILRRMESRFLEGGGIIPGKLWLLSSPKTESDFLRQRKTESSKAKRTYFISGTPIWKIKANRDGTLAYADSKTFKVFVGSDNQDPQILDPAEDSSQYEPEFVFEVPVDLEESFQKDLLSSIKDHVGVSTASSINLFRFASKLASAATIPHRFRAETLELDFWDPNDTIESFAHSAFFREPMMPHCVRCLHLDLGLKKDKLGLAAAFGYLENSTMRIPGSDPITIRTRKVIVDWVLSIQAKPGQEILIEKVERFFAWLRGVGYPIALITTDQFQCLHWSSMVLTKRGIIPIKDVLVGDRVYSKTGWRLVKNTICYRRAPLLEVRTSRGYRIRGTPNHRIEASHAYLNRKSEGARRHVWGWSRLDGLKEGCLVNINTVSVPDAGEMQLIPYGLEKSRGRMSKATEHPTLDEGLGEVMGWVCGDGGFTEDGLGFTLGTLDDVDSFRVLFRRVFGIEASITKTGEHWQSRINSQRLKKGLLSCGFEKKASYEKRIDSPIWKSPRSVQAAFLRGLFGSDGSVCGNPINGGQVSLCSSSRGLLEDVQILLSLVFGIKSTISIGRRKYKGDYRTSREEVYYLRLVGDRSRFNEIGFSSIRKSAEYARFSGIPGRVTYDKVVSISAGEGDVYDLEVEEDPSYLVGGFISHNSSGIRQNLALRGVPAKHLSVDGANREPYLGLKMLVNQGRCLLPNHKLLLKEAREIRDYGDKIDHPSTGSKDILDGVAGATHSVMSLENLYRFVDDDSAPKDPIELMELIKQGLLRVPRASMNE